MVSQSLKRWLSRITFVTSLQSLLIQPDLWWQSRIRRCGLLPFQSSPLSLLSLPPFHPLMEHKSLSSAEDRNWLFWGWSLESFRRCPWKRRDSCPKIRSFYRSQVFNTVTELSFIFIGHDQSVNFQGFNSAFHANSSLLAFQHLNFRN